MDAAHGAEPEARAGAAGPGAPSGAEHREARSPADEAAVHRGDPVGLIAPGAAEATAPVDREPRKARTRLAEDAELPRAVGRGRADVGDEGAAGQAPHQDAGRLAPLGERRRLPEAGPRSATSHVHWLKRERQRGRRANERNESEPRRQAPGAYFAAAPLTAPADGGAQ